MPSSPVADALKPDTIADALTPGPIAAAPAVAPAAAVAPVGTAPAAAVSPQVAAVPDAGGAPSLPALGILPGQANLDPKLAPKVPDGAARPLAMAEHVVNPDGSTSNEISVTVTDPTLNGGKPTLLPSLWVVDGKPTRVNEDQAVDLAKQSGLTFKSFDSLDAAEKFATDRETAWQTTKPEDAGKVEPLWSAGDAKTDKPAAVDVTSTPATGILKLTPELIQRVLSDPQLSQRLKEIMKPTGGSDYDADLTKAAQRASNAGQ